MARRGETISLLPCDLPAQKRQQSPASAQPGNPLQAPAAIGGAYSMAASIPPLPSIVMPLLIGTWLFTLGIVDLAVDTSGDPALFSAWYGAADTLPIISHFFQRVLPVMLIGMLAKLLLKSVPAALKGRPGGLPGCAPLLLLPLIIFTSVKAKGTIESTKYRSELRPSVEQLALVTQLHMARAGLSICMTASGIAEYALQLRAGLATLRKTKAE